jgi:hypothetical protein
VSFRAFLKLNPEIEDWIPDKGLGNNEKGKKEKPQGRNYLYTSNNSCLVWISGFPIKNFGNDKASGHYFWVRHYSCHSRPDPESTG